MTVKEVCEKFTYSQSTIINNFSRFQKAVQKKYGVLLVKTGRGKDTVYDIIEDNSRAETLYKQDETRTVMLSTRQAQIIQFDFMVFLGIIMTPLQVFRGSYSDFLNYVQVQNNKENRKKLKQSLELLNKEDYIHYNVDKTDQNYFFAGIYRKVEEKISVGINMIRECKLLAFKEKKRSWVNLLKVWLGVKYLYIQDLQPYTVQDLCNLTGLSAYQIREAGKVLEKDNVFRSDKVYVSYQRCLGKNSVLNILHEGNQDMNKNAISNSN